jgi:ABC-type Fe3+/spermidine/putrescine transport system ATPase subunit
MKQNDQQYILKIEDLSKQFSQKTIFSAINFDISKGEIVALLGPSGCGKSTLLRMICGLETIENGSISFADADEAVIDTEMKNIRQSVGLIFQKPVLFPHLNVAGNIILGMSKPPSRKLRYEVTEKYLEDVGLSGFSTHSVETLSGGEAQRVCLVRALISEPKLLLLDEPFSSLDVKSRRKIAIETKQILKKKGISALHVTHDPEEAKLISDRVIKWQDLVN